MTYIHRIALLVGIPGILMACSGPPGKSTFPLSSYPAPATASASSIPILNSPTPHLNPIVTRTAVITAFVPSPTPTIQFFPRNDSWVEFRNTRIGYTVAFPPGSHFEYAEWPQRPIQNYDIDQVMIWPKAENVSGGLFVEINTMLNIDHLSADGYFALEKYLSSDPIDITIKNATKVDFHGATGMKYVTRALADQYIILVPYKDYMVRLTVVLGREGQPYEMTAGDNQFMDVFLSRFTFNY